MEETDLVSSIEQPTSSDVYAMVGKLQALSDWLLVLFGFSVGFGVATSAGAVCKHFKQEPFETTLLLAAASGGIIAFVLWRFATFKREAERTRQRQARQILIEKAVSEAIAPFEIKTREMENEWNTSNPLGRLIEPWVTRCSIDGLFVHVETVAVNVFHLPRRLYMRNGVVIFTAGASDGPIATCSLPVWSDLVQGRTVRQPLAAPEAGVLQQGEYDAIRVAKGKGVLRTLVKCAYEVDVDSGPAIQDKNVERTWAVNLDIL
jgi:hypothetical protein